MATNDFLPFSTSGTANVYTNAQYVADPDQANGNQPGLAKSKLVNKALRQCSIISTVVAQYIADVTGNNAVDDGTTTTLLTNLKNAVSANNTIGTIAALRLTPYTGQQIIYVTGYYTAADNIGVREYFWDATSTEADNGGTIIKVTGVTTGRWKMKYSGAVNALWFGVNTTRVDNETPINTALSVANAILPEIVITISGSIVIPNNRTLSGCGYSISPNTAKTIIKKSGNFTGVIVGYGSELSNLNVEGVAGNGGDGIQQLGARSIVSNVASLLHGNDGVKIGGYNTQPLENTNLWRGFNIIARSNTRHGIFISHEGTTTLPNANGGMILGIDAGLNGGDGIAVGEAIDNQLFGIAAQSNTGYGVHLYNYAKGNFITAPYCEANTAGELILDSGSTRNYVYGVRSGANNDGYTNNGTENIILGRYAAVNSTPFHESAEAFAELDFMEKTTSGIWSLKKEPTTRNLLLSLSGTSASADLILSSVTPGTSGFRFTTGTDTGAFRNILQKSSTLSFGAIAANSSVDVVVTLTGADSTYSYSVNPTYAIPAGVTWGVYWDSTSSQVKVRCSNVTTGSISISGGFKVVAIKIT